MKLPIIDHRDKKEIYNQIVSMAEEYVPEWNPTDNEDDVGVILAKIFSEMFEETIQRFNKMPYKNYVYFLNLLGATMQPAISSHGYATVELTDMVDTGVYIKKGTHLYGQSKAGERVLFETKEDMSAVYNQIEDIYCRDGNNNQIIKQELPCTLFDFYGSENLQKRRMIFAQKDVLMVGKEAHITMYVFHQEKFYLETKLAKSLADNSLVRWEYLTNDGWKEIKQVTYNGNRVEFKVNEEIPLVTYEEIENRWISCTIIKENDFEEITFTDLKLISQNENLLPEALYYNDVEMTKTNFLPFGESFSVYDDFYINSNEVFSKRGALITMHMTVDTNQYVEEEELQSQPLGSKWKSILSQKEFIKPKKEVVELERVIWEYWNGIGWTRLFEDNSYEDIFMTKEKTNIKMNFYCPEDIDYTYIGASYGLWIRARIQKVKNAFVVDSFYQYPIVEKLNLTYGYKEYKGTVEHIFVEKDLETTYIPYVKNKEITLYKKEEASYPECYLSMSYPIPCGPIKLYFQKEGEEHLKMPSLKWQYFGKVNGVCKWIDIRVLDETNHFGKSGIITFLSKGNFELCKLFGKERYWIRLVNQDKRYEIEASLHSVLKGIYFNTVKIVQQETMEEEYFPIISQESNKVCHLSGTDILEAEVWIDERENILADDRYQWEEIEDNVEIEREEDGMITHYWVKWKQISNIKMASSEDRVYMLEKTKGKLLFGDGICGKLPCSKQNTTIRVNYSVSMGEQGNFEIGEINEFSDSIPFVSRVYNVECVSGGCDSETIEAATNRCTKMVKHQNRAVSKDDYEDIVKQIDRNIVKTKVLANVNEEEKVQNGFITLVVLPKYLNHSGNYFDTIKDNVMAQLQKKLPVVLRNQLSIVQVRYIEICVSVKVIVENYEDYMLVSTQVQKKLDDYLNPITGDFSGNGFEIGKLPTKTQIYNFIRTVNKIKKIENLMIDCYIRTKEEREEMDYEKVLEFEDVVPLSGVHQVDIEIF